MCPTETEKYVGLGSAVLISSSLAAVSGTIALATAAGGGSNLGTWVAVCLPLGLVYGTIVFAIDRFMVSSSLNPVTDVDLTGARRDGNGGRAGRLRRVGEVARTLGSAAPRLILAGLIGVLVAEPVLLVVFRHEIDQRVVQMQAELLAAAEEQVDVRYDDELERITEREAELTGTDPGLVAAEAGLADLDDDLEDATTELAELQVMLRSEIAGVSVGDDNSGTSGQAGDGPVADELRAEIDLQQARLDGLVSRRDAQQERVDGLSTTEQNRDDGAVGELDTLAAQRLTLTTDRQTELDAVAAQSGQADGLLVRIEALEWLTRHHLLSMGDDLQQVPVTDDSGEPSAIPASSAGGGLTTIGLAVWLVRLWVLVLDAIPIAFKVLLSLRERRPYDALLAAHEAAEVELARSMVDGGPRRIARPLLTTANPGSVPASPSPAAAPAPSRAGTDQPADGDEPPDDGSAPTEEQPTGARYLAPTMTLGRFVRR